MKLIDKLKPEVIEALDDAKVQFQNLSPNVLGGPRIVYKKLEKVENDV